MLELGKRGHNGVQKKAFPLLVDGGLVGTATRPRVKRLLESWELDVVLQTGHWIMDMRKDASARRADDPEATVRMAVEWWRGRKQHIGGKRGVVIDLEGATLDMVLPRGWRARPTQFYRGEQLVAVGSHNIGVTPRPNLTTHTDLPLHHQVFLLCVLWKRLEQARSSSSVG